MRTRCRCGNTAKQSSEQLIHAAGGEYLGHAGEPRCRAWSLHETGTLPHGERSEEVRHQSLRPDSRRPESVFVCDASVFPNCTDKTTTISILAFSLRASEHLLEQFAVNGFKVVIDVEEGVVRPLFQISQTVSRPSLPPI